MKEKLLKLLRAIKKYGFWRVVRRIRYNLSLKPGISKVVDFFADKKLERILKRHRGQEIIIGLSSIDWKLPLFQRPQHMAIQLGKKGYLYFYDTLNIFDYINGYKKVSENVYLTNRFEDVFNKLKGESKYIRVDHNMKDNDGKYLEEAIKGGDKVIYDYLDEMNAKLSGRKIPEFIIRRHERLLREEENCYVIATANKLYDDITAFRTRNFKLIPNGVVYEHFRNIKKYVPREIKDIISEGKPVIGYYGAFGSWFDYEMVKETAGKRKDWNFLCMGWDYDESLGKSRMKEIDNIHILGAIQYKKLPLYAQWFDVSTIPFQINEITRSTSPVKIFEYMALGKPIVSTPIPECKKYKSIFISENNTDDYIKNLEMALEKVEDDKYQDLLKTEALENTWERRAQELIDLISDSDVDHDPAIRKFIKYQNDHAEAIKKD